MTIKIGISSLLLAGGLWPACASAQTIDLNGAWADKVATCGKVFEKKDGKISLRPDSDAFGNGFVVDGNRIVGKMATCNVKVRKQQGDTVNLVTTCATTVAFEHVQIHLKIDSADKITQIFPGVPELTVSYERCKL